MIRCRIRCLERFLLLPIAFITILLISCQPSSPPVSAVLNETAENYRSLRPVSGQFSGGEWEPAVDEWQGEKHQLMIELGQALGDGGYSRETLETLMGQPDEVLDSTDPMYAQLVSPNQEYGAEAKLLIFYWRGQHDYLYFVSENGNVVAADWWYAGE